MDIGKLNQRITIQSPATGRNEYGEQNVGWTDFAVNVPASVLDLSSREFLAAAATQNTTQTKIIIRALVGVLPSMRIIHGPDTYNIEGILRQRDTSLLLMCKRAG